MKIAVLVSGGVDSSLALQLLRDAGHDITAFYLKIWLEDELSYLGSCPWQDDLAYAKAHCDRLGVPLKVVSLQQEYRDRVVAYTVASVRAGRTPNPDVLCNQRIKFGAFYDKIGDEFDQVATGHYAKVEEQDGLYLLKTTSDPVKDQTYFLANLNQNQLSRAIFPIGHLTKEQVRELAQQYDLPSKNRKDSQGICFLGKIKFKDFIQHHVGVKHGDIVEFETGDKIGEHEGFWYHTIGQRKGLGLSGGPWYVVAKDLEKNIVYASNKYHEPEKKRDQFEVGDCHWIAGPPDANDLLHVKLRHGSQTYGCSIVFQGDGNRSGTVTLDGRDQGIAPGQFAVFYRGGTCLGCGVIGPSSPSPALV
ncbi:tRNA 2-thiouridine(34) synthase MnmA [Candidatus Dependentiae bacterium]|nr:tRNA 2-thiouridine(34) synthase MnmA [Candidatus Dependentiae bacterium]